MENKTRNWSEFIGALCIISIGLFLLTPRYFTIGGETWKVWAASTMLTETLRFPQISMGPLYYIYLIPFKVFEYPLSTKVEFVVTHLLCYLSLFCLLKRFISFKYAVLLVCVWIPSLSCVESTKYVAGIGLLAFHFSQKNESVFSKGYFPPYLVMAFLCHWGLLFFWVGHFVGTLWERVANKSQIFSFQIDTLSAKIALTKKIALAILIGCVLIFQSPRIDNNGYMTEYPYAPISLESHFDVAFFQIGNAKYVMRHYPEEEWYKKDWYFTNQEIFDGAETFMDALKKRPDVVLENIKDNITSLIQVPGQFILGISSWRLPIYFFWFLLSTIMMSVGILGYFITCWKHKKFSYITANILGCSSLLVAFTLTNFSERYYMVLLPVGLLFFMHIDRGVEILFSFIRKYLPKLEVRLPTIKSNSIKLAQWKEWTVGLTAVVVLFVALQTHYFPKGVSAQFGATLKGEGWLVDSNINETSKTSWHRAYKHVFKHVNRNTRILSPESVWLKAHANINWDTVYDVLYLPPFEDTTGNTEEFLNSLDLIFVTPHLETKVGAWATQHTLRYHTHIAPFLKKAVANKWVMEEIPYYGKIYKKQN